MNKTISGVMVIAFLLYVGSYAACVHGEQVSSDYCCMEETSFTFWNYASLVLLIVALGFTIAAIKLQREYNKDDD